MCGEQGVLKSCHLTHFPHTHNEKKSHLFQALCVQTSNKWGGFVGGKKSYFLQILLSNVAEVGGTTLQFYIKFYSNCFRNFLNKLVEK